MVAPRARLLLSTPLLVGVFALAVLQPANSQAQESRKPAAAKPAPYVVPGGKIYAKKGYKFVTTGRATAVVETIAAKKEVTGSFKCACTGSGACELTTDGKTMTCDSSGPNLCIDCRMTVVVNPASPSPSMAKQPASQLPPGTYIKRPPVKKEGVKPRAP